MIVPHWHAQLCKQKLTNGWKKWRVGAMTAINERAVIGGNNPPVDPFEALSRHAGDILELADGVLTGSVIESAQQAAQLEELKADISRAIRDMDAARKAEKEPHDLAAKAVQAKWTPIIKKLQTANEVAAKALTAIKLEQEQERQRLITEKRAEAEKLQAEALAKFHDSRPSDLGARYEAEEAAKRANIASVTANKIEREATGLRTYCAAHIVDFDQFLQFMLLQRIDDLTGLLNQYVQTQKNAGVRRLPGVIFKQEKRVV
jgi:hypothetical protein